MYRYALYRTGPLRCGRLRMGGLRSVVRPASVSLQSVRTVTTQAPTKYQAATDETADETTPDQTTMDQNIAAQTMAAHGTESATAATNTRAKAAPETLSQTQTRPVHRLAPELLEALQDPDSPQFLSKIASIADSDLESIRSAPSLASATHYPYLLSCILTNRLNDSTKLRHAFRHLVYADFSILTTAIVPLLRTCVDTSNVNAFLTLLAQLSQSMPVSPVVYRQLVGSHTAPWVILGLIRHGFFPNSPYGRDLMAKSLDSPSKVSRDQRLLDLVEAVCDRIPPRSSAARSRSQSRSIRRPSPPTALLYVLLREIDRIKDPQLHDVALARLVDALYRYNFTHIQNWRPVVQMCALLPSRAVERFYESDSSPIPFQVRIEGLLVRERNHALKDDRRRNVVAKVLRQMDQMMDQSGAPMTVSVQVLVLQLMCHLNVRKAAVMFREMATAHAEAVEQIAVGYLGGLYHSQHYLRVLKNHNVFVKNGLDTANLWNFAVSAAARSLRHETMRAHLNHMIERGIPVFDQQIVDAVLCFASRGRKALGNRHDRKQRPAQPPLPDHFVKRNHIGSRASKRKPLEHNPLPILQITSLVDWLGYNQLRISQQRLPWFLDQLMPLNFNYTDIQQLVMAVLRAHIMEPGALALELDQGLVDRLLEIGYRKAPTRPWMVLELLKELKGIGVTIPEDYVRAAFARHISMIFGASRVKGEAKRIREQASQSQTFNAMVADINSAWQLLYQQ